MRHALPRLAAFLVLSVVLSAQTKIQSPSEFLGFEVGADRKLADYKQISDYFRALDAASGRIEIQNLGKTTLGADMLMVLISSEQNLKQKDRYKQISKKLADPRGLSQQEVDALVKEGKTILLITCNIHATEIASSQMAMEWAHRLATAQDAETKKRLDDVIILLLPSLNPDGQTLETEWYRQNLGTKFEGGRAPRLYHHYAGHDNNRDWFMLTQKETKALNRAVYKEWYPQIWIDEHQMGQYGPRIFVPPYADPVSHRVNPLIFRGLNLIGTNMAWRLEEKKKAGVIYGYSFDAYWLGGTRNTGWWKNIFGVLTEVASARMATPIEVAPTELSGGGKGLVEYGKQINFPNPWPGGLWRMRDIMDYELIISDATHELASVRREDWLRGVVTLSQEAVASAKKDEYFTIPVSAQRDPVAAARLAHLMLEHGVDVLAEADKSAFHIPLAQPYSYFVTEMLTGQRYPEVRPVEGSGILQPYDVAAWSLPLMMGVEVKKTTVSTSEVKRLKPATEDDWYRPAAQKATGQRLALPAASNASVKAANAVLASGGEVRVAKSGALLIPASAAAQAEQAHVAVQAAANEESLKLRKPRVGLYKPFLASMDEGWTRFILEQYGFDLKNIENKAMKAGNLNAAFDVVILPDVGKEVMLEGRPRREGYFEELPPEYAGGMGKEGVAALKEFVQKGGTLITLASSSELVISDFNLPVRNGLANVKESDFNVPGSLLRAHIDASHPVGHGMPHEAAVFVDSGITFQTTNPPADVQRQVIAWYPADEEDILMSGWIKGAEKLERKAAAVAFTQGKGKIVMFGFRPQHRAQTEGTFKMLFNAIYWGVTE